MAPFPYSALIGPNSVYAEFIDRQFRSRGMATTTFGGILTLAIVALGSVMIVAANVELRGSGELWLRIGVTVAMAGICYGGAFLIWKQYYRYEFFAYTHYPIRFNRNTQKVHVFRHNGAGGVLTVPFDEVFWHIGRGLRDKYLCDVRGHVLEGNEVKDTFAVGHYFDDTRLDRIYSVWEFIRRYMEEGPEAVAEHPLDRVIDLSMTPTWTNCYLWVAASMGMTMLRLRFVLFFIYYPLVGLLTLVRWLVLNSCKTPIWPPEIEAECRTPQDDPHRWEEPRYHWEFANRPGVMARELEREGRQQHYNC